MTDRVCFFTVALAQDMRDDDARELASAIQRMRGVSEVVLGAPVNPTDLAERIRIRNELADMIMRFTRGESA